MTVADDAFSVPASYAQQRMWFLDQYEPDNTAYAMTLAVRLRGALDIAVLGAAVRSVVDRHETLRTTFADVDGTGSCQQVVDPDGRVDLDVRDLSDRPDPLGAAQELLADLERGGFDLATGPLLLIVLAKVGADEHLLIVRMHHIISDGWTLGVIARDLAEFYRAAVEQRAPVLPELQIQYADYAVWQREWMADDAVEGELAFWRDELDGTPDLVDLPLDRPRTAQTDHRGALLTRRWNTQLLAGLRRLARERDATLFMVLLAGYAATLSRFGAGADIVIGTPVAGRGRPELDDLVGLFVNTLPLRVRVDGTQDFGQLVEHARDVAVRALDHQEVSFERLVEELRPERSPTHLPIVQTMLVLQNTPGAGVEWPGLTMSPFERGSGELTAKFDLSVFAYELGGAGAHGVGEELQIEVEYDIDIFDEATIARLIDHLHDLLAAAVAEPERPLARLAPTAPATATVTAPGPAPAGVSDPVTTLPMLFAEQVARTPDAVAIEWDGQELTFAELDARVDSLCTRLLLAGAVTGPEPLVAVHLPRTPELVVTLLAVLRAGAAYLPLDPTYPPDRLAVMLSDSHATTVVSDSALASVLPPVATRRLLFDQPDATTWTTDAGSRLVPRTVPAASLAYVLYTSGSTGRPKGVQLTHANAVAMLRWAARMFGPEDRARLLATTSICFDLSIFELFLPLCFGGTVVLADDILAASGAGIPVTLVNTVPSAFAEVLRAGVVSPGARIVNLAGEALPAQTVAGAYADDGVTAVYNLYGPTEGTTYSTIALVPPGDRYAPSVGRPITGTVAYLVDDELRPVPSGAPGEVFLGGLGVSRGYLNRPALTAERYVPDPFAATPGARMYRTSDLARLRGDDVLDYRGRLDHQVKLRGFRIELGEIASVLRDHPGVREAVVVKEDDSSVGPRLVAYVAADDTADLRGELALECARRLPAFMVPAGFVVLAELPHTPNGKLDRLSLPGLAAADRPAAATSQSRAPDGPIERQVAAVWAELLDLDTVGADDNFFALGGHSLLATQLVARLQASFGVTTPLRAVFETPTVAGLSVALVAAEHSPGEVQAIAELREQIERLTPEQIMAQLDEE